VAFITLGCRANQYDTSVMMAGLDPERFAVADISHARNRDDLTDSRGYARPADIYVINTCTVTNKSDFQSRQMVRRARRWNPEAKIIVTGCLVETNPKSLHGLPFDHLVRPDERRDVARIIMDGIREKVPSAGNSGFFYHPEAGLQLRTRALVKIQDGCDLRCSYCTVPLARGRSRSLEPEKVLHQLKALFHQGFLEAVITGINLGAYGRDIGTSLLELLEHIEDEKDVPPRIRLSSLEPHEIYPALIEHLGKSRRICPHLHLPLQSGDDRILAGMKRIYKARKFSDIVRNLHQAMPGLCLGMDVIAGFPGETDQSFENTLRLLESLPFAYLHVFPFSPRPGTEAAEFKDRVHSLHVKSRTRVLRRLGEDRRKRFYHDHQRGILRVLFESHESGWLRGLSNNYIPVRAQGPKEFTGRLVQVQAETVNSRGITGRIKQSTVNS
jgi:threonylcarbamoyladenosine tRNA methylthiotransferase MtaB